MKPFISIQFLMNFILALLFLLILSNCTEKYEILEIIDDRIIPFDPIGINTPKLNSINFDWENSDEIYILKDNVTIRLPWKDWAPGLYPSDLHENFTSNAGWALVYNMCQTTQSPYLIFYNKLSGRLRVYYYLHSGATGTSGLWNLTSTNSHSCLNAVGHFTGLVNERRNNPRIISNNITNFNSNHPFQNGWNIFETEITYDPLVSSKVIQMSMGGLNNNLSIINLEGAYNETSEGTIVSTDRENVLGTELKDAGVKAFGKGAEEWVKSQIGTQSKHAIKAAAAALQDFTNNGTTALLNYGINLVFGSFFTNLNEPIETTQQISLTTNGKITTSGTITSTVASEITGFTGAKFPGSKSSSSYSIIPHYDYPLGVWNLKQPPIVKLSNKAYFLSYYNYNTTYARSETYIEPSTVSLSNVDFNPAILNLVNSIQISSQLVYYKRFNNVLNWRPEVGYFNQNVSGGIIYSDSSCEIYKYPVEKFEVYGPDPFQNFPPDQMPYISVNQITNNYVVKVTISYIPNGSNKRIYSTKSYLPTFQLFEPAPLDPGDWIW